MMEPLIILIFGQLTAYYANNLKIQIYRLNNNGDGDDVLLSEVTWLAHTGSSAINTWKNVDIDYTANSLDASSANGIAIRLFKTFGTGMKIDDFKISCTSCYNGTGIITLSGTPIVNSGTFNYTIPLTGGCGNVNATGTIIVSPE